MSSANAKQALQGFEAAARNLSFTKAAEELFITQSAVSRQVKALEDHLGVTLFERQQRALALTESGHALYRVATDVLERLQAATDQLRASGRSRQLSLTTTTGFASLWLIPRLQRFTSLHPDVDVRISATTTVINLERSLVDLAIRYCRPEDVPERAIRLFGEEVVVVCSPSLLRDRSRPLKRPHDLKHHVLLHFDYAGTQFLDAQFLDWGTWSAALQPIRADDPGRDQRARRGARPPAAGQRPHPVGRAGGAVPKVTGGIARVFHHRIRARRRKAARPAVRRMAYGGGEGKCADGVVARVSIRVNGMRRLKPHP